MIPTMKFINTSITSHKLTCFVSVRMLKIYYLSKFQVCSTVLFIIVNMQ